MGYYRFRLLLKTHRQLAYPEETFDRPLGIGRKRGGEVFPHKRNEKGMGFFHFLTHSSNRPLGEKGRPGFAERLFSYLQWSQLPSLKSSPFSQADSISRLALPQGEAPTANVDIDPKKIVEYRVEAVNLSYRKQKSCFLSWCPMKED